MGILSRKIVGIYKITNLVNGKVYIGQSRHIYNRWAQHRHGRSKDHNYYLANAINKYGIDKFAFEILVECSIDELNDLERKYITQYGCVKPSGYNLDSGGNQGKEITTETRKRMSLAWLFRSPATDQERHNKAVAHHKPVSQYALDGTYINTFPSIKQAAKTIGFPESNIINCCKGKRNQKTVGGYQWRYASTTKNIEPVSYRFGEGHHVPVSQYALDGKHIKTYGSLKEAGKAVKISSTSISECLNGKQKTAGGFAWRYANDNHD